MRLLVAGLRVNWGVDRWIWSGRSLAAAASPRRLGDTGRGILELCRVVL